MTEDSATASALSKTCCKVGCSNRASVAPKVCVPATGWPIGSHKPLEALLGLPLCKDHFEEINSQELVQDEKMRQVFRSAARMNGSPLAPDFKRTFVVPVRLDSDEYVKFTEMKKRTPSHG